jgi:hypothetical protein
MILALVLWALLPSMADEVSPKPQAKADAIEITLTRTPCFGTCPDYEVTLRGDGTVTYEGRANVRLAGERTWKIDPAAVRALAREMQDAGYFELKDEYSALVTDLPTTYTSLTIGSRTKKIKDYYQAPEKLRDLENRIDLVSDAKRYVFISGAAIREMQQTGWRATGDDARDWMTRAIYAGDADVVGALVAAGYDAKAADENGVTLLMRAAEVGYAEPVRLLIAAGADKTVRDRGGRNAADRARDGLASGTPRQYDAILKLLTDELMVIGGAGSDVASMPNAECRMPNPDRCNQFIDAEPAR